MTKTKTTGESEGVAIGIYAVMARDPLDALDLIAECGDRDALGVLGEMIARAHERPGTDNELNSLFREPVARRLAELAESAELTERTDRDGRTE
jgi:hypothetical protein